MLLEGAVLDDDRTHVPVEARPIGVVFQDLLLFPHLSALENVAFPLRSRGVSRSLARRRASELLEHLGVAERASARPPELSGGEAQRVALARALANRPDLLLLDEPLSSLDVSARRRIRDLLRRELAGFPGVRVLVTHDPVEAMTMADRMVLLEAGRVTQVGSPEEIRATPRTPYAAELVGVNFLTGRLEPLEAGVGRLVGPEGELVVPWPRGVEPGQEVIGLLRPADVVLHRDRPEGSARNLLRGRVLAVDIEGGRARVRIASQPPIVAEVTMGSIERLQIADGVGLWASFKAVEVEVIPS